jgi:hypothetical protein
MAITGEKWRGILGGLEERKAPLELERRRVRPKMHMLSVRAVAGGYAVFGEHGDKISEVFERRADAVAEAEGFLGDGSLLLEEGPTGHVENEVMRRSG